MAVIGDDDEVSETLLKSIVAILNSWYDLPRQLFTRGRSCGRRRRRIGRAMARGPQSLLGTSIDSRVEYRVGPGCRTTSSISSEPGVVFSDHEASSGSAFDITASIESIT